MVKLSDFAATLKSVAESSREASRENMATFEELFSRALRNALDRINGGEVDSYELGPWVVSNLILLADLEGYELSETMAFLRVILD